MATILEALKGINAYPVPLRTLAEVSERRGLPLSADASVEALTGKAYRLATADILLWLSLAPNVTQGGQSYSFTDEQRNALRKRADALYSELDQQDSLSKPVYGYKGKYL